jgi:hypothetical protein
LAKLSATDLAHEKERRQLAAKLAEEKAMLAAKWSADMSAMKLELAAQQAEKTKLTEKITQERASLAAQYQQEEVCHMRPIGSQGLRIFQTCDQ